ncbi:hypothetical protein SPHINGO391_410053 [Sphingomonas aurantiaca]|uniref:Uncharacterized protein n=1 Tax=Sphingomonas aurantiaca TaxID=185949 RepID=A0A2T5GK09_9SPHN|nr:hypothetical protein [Sphingomonas aurantiaca]PTQ59662.1 hypothetical protein C8J26_2514 [Sphingomonas aurantiaca]VVT11414.1 hypothetical protein SPHINGO391_410053 [Sphingomonas aurantiaca]
MHPSPLALSLASNPGLYGRDHSPRLTAAAALVSALIWVGLLYLYFG